MKNQSEMSSRAKPVTTETHDRTGAEGDGEALVERFLRGRGGPGRGVGRRLHPEEAAQTGEQAGDGDATDGPEVLQAAGGHEAEQHEQGDEHARHDPVLSSQIRTGTVSDRLRDPHHLRVTFRVAHDGLVEEECGDQGADRADRSKEPRRRLGDAGHFSEEEGLGLKHRVHLVGGPCVDTGRSGRT